MHMRMNGRVKIGDRRGFTIVELLVVSGVIALILAIAFPALMGARTSAGIATCANNLRQLGVAATAYLSTYKDHLPQAVAVNPFTGQEEVIGTLFGGKRGTLSMFGIDQIGADRRPLNKFVSSTVIVDTDPSDGNQEDIPVFRCPLDRGQPAQPPFLPQVDQMYDFVGTSYTLNDHTLDSEDCSTLVPKRTGDDPTTPQLEGRPGGKMPFVENPSKTWMLGDLPIYNYQEGGDRQQRWHRGKASICECNLCFVDGHVGPNLTIPPSTFGPEGCIIQNTTADYTFLPSRRWLDQSVSVPHCPPCVGSGPGSPQPPRASDVVGP